MCASSADSNCFEREIIRPFIDSCVKFADNNAFCIDSVFYTYRTFAAAVNGIREQLISLMPGEYVGLVANDDLETYATIFACWLEGKAYIPLPNNQPIERCRQVIDQVQIKVIADSGTNSRFDKEIIIYTHGQCVDGPIELQEHYPDNIDAYILFTSGSTGVPKGVPISRKNLAAFVQAFWRCGIALNAEDRCLQCFDLTFDISVQSYLTPLLSGACVYTVPHHQIKYSYVFTLLEDHQLTFGAMTPSLVRYLKPYFEEISLPHFKTCIVSGEASPLDLVMQWRKCIPAAEIHDCYGPTEATIYCTWYTLPPNETPKSLNGMLCIGKPFLGLKAIVVNEQLNPLPDGEQGELCIAGDQVTAGYWQLPEKNKVAFFEKEIEGETFRFYRTGDLCYIDEDGDIMLFGRSDSQVKIQGFRVEIGEIEFHAREFLNGINAVGIPFINPIGNTELALVVEAEDKSFTGLLDHLKSKLPFYMIPTHIIGIPEFDLNTNGKVDKNLLRKKIKV